MERMKDFKAEIDRLVGEYIVELEEENKKLKEENKKLKEELSKYKKQYQHSMGFSDFGGYYLDNNK